LNPWFVERLFADWVGTLVINLVIVVDDFRASEAEQGSDDQASAYR